MSRVLAVSVLLGLSLTLGACAAAPVDEPTNGGSTQSRPTPTPDQALVPTEMPSAVVAIDPEEFNNGFDEYVFKVGEGPTWCTISPVSQFTLCEQNEAAAVYQPIPAPESCVYSYGYQVRLWSSKPESGETAEFACSGGFYSDASQAKTLLTGQSVSAAGFTCFVENVTARCDNASGQWIALGPQVWSLNN
ncbi:hypothetical protein [Rhodoluna limnophila]|uniref:hypothetical protein n=1 Tax=Rhodoluna limnophila TaxID=232537 RepID=UPI001106115A|nr:hypothetical protein [Rhodoluna limnophila]